MEARAVPARKPSGTKPTLHVWWNDLAALASAVSDWNQLLNTSSDLPSQETSILTQKPSARSNAPISPPSHQCELKFLRKRTSVCRLIAPLKSRRRIQHSNRDWVGASFVPKELLSSPSTLDLSEDGLWSLIRICFPVLSSFGLPPQLILSYVWNLSLPTNSLSSSGSSPQAMDAHVLLSEFFGTC